MKQEWDIRPAHGNDLPFIYSTWLNSYYSDSYLRKNVPKYVYFQEYPKVIDYILGSAITLVACSRVDPNVIFGYLVYDLPNICHYAFTKEGFRRLGVLITLWERPFFALGQDIIATHKTRCIEEALRFYNVQYNPFLIYQRGMNGTT